MIIGIAGTAKNTGKTTALGVLLHEAHKRDLKVGLTGIGYDGEERDTVTMLPKPRLCLETGTLVTTSASCLRVSNAGLEQVEQTPFRTALGQVLILRVTRPGLVVVAGPSKTDELRVIVSRMQALGAGFVFVDGSLNRIAPMVVADRLVFATGAARTTDVDKLVAETLAIERLFSFPLAVTPGPPAPGIQLIGEDVRVYLVSCAVQGQKEIEQALRKLPDGLRQIVVPGMVTLEGLKTLVSHMVSHAGHTSHANHTGHTSHANHMGHTSHANHMGHASHTSHANHTGHTSHASHTGHMSHGGGIELIFDDPLKLLLAGDPANTAAVLESMVPLAVAITFRHAPRLVAIAINPSYPAFDGAVYHPALLDSGAMLQRLRERLSTPVADVFSPGGGGEFCCSVFDPPSAT
jgi:hypothetical protein